MLFRGLGALPFFFWATSASTTELFGTTIVESCLTYHLGTQKTCYVPTTTRTETIFESPAFASSTSTPLITTTLIPSTQTISSTKTITSTITDSTITDTFTSTSTIFTTIIDTTVVSLTLTSTETVSSTTTTTTTTTIPTLTSFLPVSDTTASAYPDVQLRKRDREFSHIRDFSNQISHSGYHKISGFYTAQAQSIECIVFSEIRATFVTILTGKAQTKTVTPMPTSTTITILETSTSTLAPSASHTFSFSISLSATSTLTTTTIFTTTTTSSDILTVSDTITSYAACATNNLLSNFNSSSPDILDIFNNYPQSNVFTSSVLASALDCCEKCQEATDCESFGYYEETTCFLYQRPSGSCSATLSTASQSGGAGFYLYHSGEGLLVVGNGACGYLYNGGDAGE